MRKTGFAVVLRRLLLICWSSFLCLHSVCLSVAAQVQVYRSAPHTDDRMRIALTFDDGPHPRLTPMILEILEQYHVHATFFMVGQNIVNYPNVARAVLDGGHEIGNHTFSHGHVRNLDEESLSDELGRCEDVLEELCEYRPHLFRPPEGAVTQFVRHCSEVGDYSLILWSLDTRDWENKSTDTIVQTVLGSIHPGDIILMHDYIGTGSQTPEALNILLPELLRRGYEPVTVSQLLGLA